MSCNKIPGLEQMQIEVVDDCSPDGAPVWSWFAGSTR